MKAYDLLIQCETGLASITGVPERAGPRRRLGRRHRLRDERARRASCRRSIERERTGEGSGVAVSLFDCLADWMTVPLLHHDYGGKAPERVGLNHPRSPPTAPIAPATASRWCWRSRTSANGSAFCRSCWSSRAGRRSALCRQRAAGRASAGAECRDRRRLPRPRPRRGDRPPAKGPHRLRFANDVADLSVHRQLRRIEVETPSGAISTAAPPIRWRDEEVHARPVPAVGQDTESLRREFAA